ncbi:putative allantoate permease [Xylaria arbuscula]|nr:putative allantoate permease [Xylaria arbuscula]
MQGSENPVLGDEESLSGPSSPRVDDKALWRKIDARIVPLLFASYFVQFLDKGILNYANIMSLQEDLGMHGQEYSWVTTAFYIAYTAAEFPHGWLLQKYPPATILGINVLIWGILVTSTAACQNFAGLLVVRILLGFFEAVIAPALVLITSQWYTRRESMPRYGLWYCGAGVDQMVGPVIAFAAQQGSRTSLSSWRIIRTAFLLLPITPDAADWLSEEQKARIHEKLALDQAGTGKKVYEKRAVVETLVFDLQAWLLSILVVLYMLPATVTGNFSAAIIKGFGYDSKTAALLNIPSGMLAIISTLGTTYAMMKGLPRCLNIIVLQVPTLIGAGLLSFYHSGKAGVLAGIYLINLGWGSLLLFYSLAGTNSQGYTKKVTLNAMMQVGHGVGALIGPQTALSWEAPDYMSAKTTVFGAFAGLMVVASVLWLLYWWRNKQRIKERQAELEALSNGHVDVQTLGQTGEVTDLRNKAFVYIY